MVERQTEIRTGDLRPVSILEITHHCLVAFLEAQSLRVGLDSKAVKEAFDVVLYCVEVSC